MFGEILVSIISFIGVLFVLVLVHEWGHYIAARKFGVRVYEFGFGFPPLVKKMWHRHGTDFTLNWIPLGGFVKLKGEDGTDADDKDSFAHQSAIKRLIILFAGVTMNFLVGFLLYVGLFMYGVQIPTDSVQSGAQTSNEKVLIGGVLKGSPAERSGVLSGDEIISIDGEIVSHATDVPRIVSAHAGQQIPFVIIRDGQQITLSLVPAEIKPGIIGAGVSVADIVTAKYSFGSAIVVAAREVYETSTIIFKTLGSILLTLFKTGELQEGVSGPVGIAVITGKVAQSGFVPLLQLMAMLSINLGVLNALPFPALDGGRALFVVIEKIVRKKVRGTIEQFAHVAGFALLMILVLAVTYRDILALIK